MKKLAHIRADHWITLCGIQLWSVVDRPRILRRGVFAQKCPECVARAHRNWITIEDKA